MKSQFLLPGSTGTEEILEEIMGSARPAKLIYTYDPDFFPWGKSHSGEKSHPASAGVFFPYSTIFQNLPPPDSRIPSKRNELCNLRSLGMAGIVQDY